MKKLHFLKIIFIATLFVFSGCETLDLDQLESPSDPNAKFLDPIYAFNYAQLEFADFIDATNNFTQRVTRQMAMTGGDTYDNAFEPASFNTSWTKGYGVLNAIKVLEPVAKTKKQNFILGASKVLRCYVLTTLVDVYGDVPYSEAIQGVSNLYPKYDNSASVYKGVLAELDEAIAILNLPQGLKGDDLYYAGNTTKWITLAKTLKFKMYFTARLAGAELGVDTKVEMENILTAGDYIDTPEEDFVFKYGSNRDVPNSRHPMYNDQYELGGGAFIGNYMMWAMTTEKGFTASPTALTPSIDPRVNYYFYKQDSDPGNDDTFTLPGRSRPAHYSDSKYNSFYIPTTATPYTVSNWTGQTSLTSSGFWGRDHGNNTGIPPDNEKRTVAGVYPIGGKFGSDAKTVQRSGVDGALGAGILPILLTSYVHFMKAEVILELGIAGDAKAELAAGVDASMDIATKSINNYPVLSANEVTRLASNKIFYEDWVKEKYDDQVSNSKKLELIVKEYYLAAWGNGIEPYNNYRRTGYPSNFQPTLETISGSFYNCGLYPSVALSSNPNTPKTGRTRKVFWDKANLNLH